MLKTRKTELHLGLQKPVRVLHLTDIHLSLADNADGDSMKRHARGRRAVFQGETNADDEAKLPGLLREAMEYGRQFDATVITGDVLDFVTHGNLAAAQEILAPYDSLFCAGNHEFTPRVGLPDRFSNRAAFYDRVQAAFRGDMTFESRVVGGVNLITMENGLYVWYPGQLEKLKREVARGYPCVIFCYVPLTSPELNHTPEHTGLEADEETIAMTRRLTRYIDETPQIQAVFAGHEHRNLTLALPSGKPCYVLGALFDGTVGEIVID